MKRVGLFIAAVLLVRATSGAAESKEVLDGLRASHPRLLFTAEEQQRIVELAQSTRC